MKKQKLKKVGFSNAVLVLIFIAGLGLLLYPTVSNWWNQNYASAIISSYDKEMDSKTKEELEEQFARAQEYNKKLWDLYFPFEDFQSIPGYEDILGGEDGLGVLGYIQIDKINVNLPILQGTSEKVLSFAVGHLEGSSLPTGEENTHAVLSAHRGLPSAKLFTDLDRLREKDIFSVTILNKKFYYQVDQIRIVEPTDVRPLYLEKGKAYCTLLTCTPYGVNSERLLIRGHAIPEPPGEVVSEAIELDSLILAPILFVLLVVVLLWGLWYLDQKKKSRLNRQ